MEAAFLDGRELGEDDGTCCSVLEGEALALAWTDEAKLPGKLQDITLSRHCVSTLAYPFE